MLFFNSIQVRKLGYTSLERWGVRRAVSFSKDLTVLPTSKSFVTSCDYNGTNSLVSFKVIKGIL